MGSSSSKPATDATTTTQKSTSSSEDSASKCPVKHSSWMKSSAAGSSNDSGNTSGGGCPIKHGNNKNASTAKDQKTVYNVYSQPISEANQMPSTANQLPAPGQQESLSKDRVSSSIPKGNTDTETWTYPSPQMFYNALARKNKLGDTKEQDIESVVALHNNMNERTWNQVKEWEKLAGEKDPKLLKFMGRPSDLSPKARIKHYFFNHPLPFDRHDWTVIRRDGTTVTYVIDYYHDETQASTDEGSGMPSLNDRVPSLLVDVRPALASPSDLYQRLVVMPQALSKNETNFQQLPLKPTVALQSQVGESLDVWQSIQQQAMQKQDTSISEKEALALSKSLKKAIHDCQSQQKAVDACKTDKERQQASLDLTLCMGRLWCPLQAADLVKALQNDDEKSLAALDDVTACVATHYERTGQASQEHPHLFEKKK